MNGTDVNTDSVKLVKTLYMRMKRILTETDDMVMRIGGGPDIFGICIEEDHIYDVLIETYDFKAKTIRNKKYTVSAKMVDNMHAQIDIHINDNTEHIDVNNDFGECAVLRIFAEGTDPDLYRTIHIVDVTGEDRSTCFEDGTEDKTEEPKSDKGEVSQTKDTDKKNPMIIAFNKPAPDYSSLYTTEIPDKSEDTSGMNDECDNEKSDSTQEITEELEDCNGTNTNIESGKFVKTLYMHMNEFLIIKGGLLIHKEENPDIFATYMEEGHIYDILIDTINLKTKTIRSKKYTVAAKMLGNMHSHIDVCVKDFREHIDVHNDYGDCAVLRIFADGTDPTVFRTIEIVDVTGEDRSTCFEDGAEDKTEYPVIERTDDPKTDDKNEDSSQEITEVQEDYNGTDVNTDSGKLAKLLYMHMSVFAIQSDDMIMCNVDNPDIFVMNMERNHTYDILIETFDFKTQVSRTTEFTVSDESTDDENICNDIHFNDYSESTTANTYSGDCSILRLHASGTDPNVYRSIQIVDVTGEDRLIQHTDKSDDGNTKSVKTTGDCRRETSVKDKLDKLRVMVDAFQKSLQSDVSSLTSTESNSNDADTTEETCDNTNTDESEEDLEDHDPEEEIKNLLDDVERLQGILIDLIEKSAVIKHSFVRQPESTIGSHIIRSEVWLLNTYLSSIGMIYGNNLERITENIKDSLDI